MTARYLRCPPAAEAEARAYAAWIDARSPWAPSPFAYVEPDAEGWWIVPWLPGHTWAGELVPAPEGEEAQRPPGAVLIDAAAVVWPEEEGV